MRIEFNSVSAPSNKTQGITLQSAKPITLKIVGNGYFTDKTLTENKGNTLSILPNSMTYIYVSNGDFYISIPDKYSLSVLSLFAEESGSDTSVKNKTVYLDQIEYSTLLTILRISSENVIGNIDSLKNLTSLTALHISNLKNVNGDIDSLKNLSSLRILQMSGSNLTGDIASLKALTSLETLMTSNLRGDISALKPLTSLKTLWLKNGSFYGDCAALSPVLSIVSFQTNTGNPSTLTWSERPSTSCIMSIEGQPKMDNIDKMLQDQAKCQTPSTASVRKIIEVIGTRTSASDAAVQTLQSKGYTVSITPA
ncbi:MAG: hypothetical protein SPM04_10920 [Lachnospira sp.]|nr:hypothetical protein [Lachnospira sp.]